MINDLLTQECTIIPTISKSANGKPQKGTLVPNVKCRAKEKYKLVKNKAAQEVVSQIEFWFSSETEIKVDDYILFNDIEHQVIAYQPKRDTLGNITRKAVFV
jgi:hypothetical protein